MKTEKIHPEVKRLVDMIGSILHLAEVGTYATDTFLVRHSLDCNFLEFSDDFGAGPGWRFEVVFYPGQSNSVRAIDKISFVTSTEAVSIDGDGRGIKKLIRIWPQVEHCWRISVSSDKAKLQWYEMRRQSGGTVSYSKDTETSSPGKWSHGTTAGYPWTTEAPKTLRAPRGGLIDNVLGVPVTPEISVKATVHSIFLRAKLSQFKEQLRKRFPKAA